MDYETFDPFGQSTPSGADMGSGGLLGRFNADGSQAAPLSAGHQPDTAGSVTANSGDFGVDLQRRPFPVGQVDDTSFAGEEGFSPAMA